MSKHAPEEFLQGTMCHKGSIFNKKQLLIIPSAPSQFYLKKESWMKMYWVDIFLWPSPHFLSSIWWLQAKLRLISEHCTLTLLQFPITMSSCIMESSVQCSKIRFGHVVSLLELQLQLEYDPISLNLSKTRNCGNCSSQNFNIKAYCVHLAPMQCLCDFFST